MTLDQIVSTPVGGPGGRRMIEDRLTCQDGFSLSVQASQWHYCRPRNDDGPWTHVEDGYPSAHEPLLDAYAENPDDPTGTVYGYVPVEVVRQVIARHGGLA